MLLETTKSACDDVGYSKFESILESVTTKQRISNLLSLWDINGWIYNSEKLPCKHLEVLDLLLNHALDLYTKTSKIAYLEYAFPYTPLVGIEVIQKMVSKTKSGNDTCLALKAKTKKGHYKALDFAIVIRDSSMVDELFMLYRNHGILDETIQEGDIRGSTALHKAIETCNNVAIRLIFKEMNSEALKKVIIQGDKDGYTPLHYACNEGSSEAIDTLLEAGKPFFQEMILSTNAQFSTPLHSAIWRNSVDVCKQLLTLTSRQKETFETLMLQGDKREYTLLHRACLNGENDIVSLILDTVMEYDKGTDTPLMDRLLLQTDIEGNTSLHLACWRADSGAVSLILKAANPNTSYFQNMICTQNKYNKTALTISIEEKYNEIAEMISRTLPDTLIAEIERYYTCIL